MPDVAPSVCFDLIYRKAYGLASTRLTWPHHSPEATCVYTAVRSALYKTVLCLDGSLCARRLDPLYSLFCGEATTRSTYMSLQVLRAMSTGRGVPDWVQKHTERWLEIQGHILLPSKALARRRLFGG